jgi:outer membrane protein assembly factor BamB
MNRSWMLAALALCCLAPVAILGTPFPIPVARAADWSLFRGNPLQTGISKDSLPDKLDTLWTFETKEPVEATAAIVKGVVYVASVDENLYAIDLETGKEKWKYHGGSFKAAPSVHGDAVYVGDMDGTFHCVDAATGKKRWTFATDGEIQSGANFAGDTVLFGSYDENLYCLSIKEGKEVWKFKINGPINGAPAVVDGKTFVAGCDSMLHILEVEKGKELRSVNLDSQVGATAAVVGDLLYVGTMGNEMLAINWKKGEVLWRFESPKHQAFYSSTAVTDDLVIAGCRDRRIWAIDRKTGKDAWSFLTNNRVDASPVVVGERIYAPSLDGKMYVLDMKGNLATKYDLGSAATASPAVSGKRLVIGTDKGVVHCFGEKK